METKATTGEVFTDRYGVVLHVMPPCAVKDRGHWYCVTHRTGLANNFDKDTHLERGRHKLAWWCNACGRFEQP